MPGLSVNFGLILGNPKNFGGSKAGQGDIAAYLNQSFPADYPVDLVALCLVRGRSTKWAGRNTTPDSPSRTSHAFDRSTQYS